MLKKKGFTLIEMLVVVLIIGILAAIAFPQYEKVVEKTRAAQAMEIMRSIYQAAADYYLATGTYPTSFDQLSIEMQWTGQDAWSNYGVTDTRSNGEWSIQLYNNFDGQVLYMGRLTGKYKGGGFTMAFNRASIRKGELRCAERQNRGVIFSGEPGDYCEKLFNATENTPAGTITFRSYVMP